MKVTVCQLDPREGQIDAYLSSLKEHIASENSEFVLLPEMSFSGDGYRICRQYSLTRADRRHSVADL